MLNSNQLLILYTRILEDISFKKCINENDVKQAIDQMHKIYQGSTNNLSKNLNCLTDFNSVTYRCAYLFKYAPFHAGLTYKAMSQALSENPFELQATLDSLSGPLKLCSLGGGPGTDVIGILAAMHEKFGFFPISAKLVDIMSEWELTFWSVVDELKFGEQFYGYLSESVSEKWFDWSFITADLQSEMSKELTEALAHADIISMVKFVSAAACKETSNMIEKIFRMMKPGAFLLFIDNAGGGFEQLISSAAGKYKLNAVSTPLKHQHYINETFNNMRYGYRSCYESKVAVQLLMKAGSTNYFNEINFAVNSSYTENFALSPVPRFQNFRNGRKLASNLMNEHESFESGSPYNCHGSNFSPKMLRFNAQIDSPVGPYKSFESETSWSSSPHSSPSRNWLISDNNQIYDSKYQNESFEHELPLNSHYSNEIDFPSSSPSFWQKIHVPKLHSKPVDNLENEYDIFKHRSLTKCQASRFSSSFESGRSWNLPLNSTPHASPFQNRAVRAVDQMYDPASDDSGYPDESFEYELSQDSPVCNGSLHFRASQRLGRYNIPKRKTIDSFNENESLWNTSENNLPQHSTLMLHDENSLLPVPYKPNLQRLNCSTRTFRNKIDDSVYSPMNSESPLHRPQRSDKHPFRSSQHSDMYRTPNGPSHVSMFQHEPYKLPEPWTNQSKKVPLLLHPPHQCVESNKAEPWTNQSKKVPLLLHPPHQRVGSNKAPKWRSDVSMHRHKPYKLIRC